jgi:CHAT domain
LPRSSRDSFAAERFEIVLVPSVAAWLRLRAAGKGRAGLALALVDPSPESDRVLGEVPLPGARREAEHAVRSFPPGSRVVTGRDASETFLKAGDLAAYSLLHALADERVGGGFVLRGWSFWSRG